MLEGVGRRRRTRKELLGRGSSEMQTEQFGTVRRLRFGGEGGLVGMELMVGMSRRQRRGPEAGEGEEGVGGRGGCAAAAGEEREAEEEEVGGAGEGPVGYILAYVHIFRDISDTQRLLTRNITRSAGGKGSGFLLFNRSVTR
ncbi:uncharacterized protein A4U43_C04F17990 [Asparagus officinalis]|uniref:Uncharacterized protein n=1 Tax=Asparagus officinalis TaxID=4686 RepID=A0A5P1F6F8_ASPOF|nr:uncharacterized protein A4U43_C04F17990 [Asparagus officinalis]